jgi:hypothetical protein
MITQTRITPKIMRVQVCKIFVLLRAGKAAYCDKQ